MVFFYNGIVATLPCKNSSMFTSRLPSYISYFFALLFIYAAVSKMLDFENFQVQLAQSPLLSAYAGFISYGVLALELLTALLLLWNKTRRAALYAAFGLMVAFTIYIYLILNYSDDIPCSCGGILEKMGWEEHLIFNIFCALCALAALFVFEKERTVPFRRTASWSSLIFLISGGGMVLVFLSSEFIMKRANNFTRRFLPHAIEYPQTLDLEVNSYYFAGQYGDTVFLGNKTAPLLLAWVLPTYKKLLTDTLDVREKSLPYKEVTLHVIYPHYSLSDGTVPVVFEGILPGKIAKLAMKGKAYFSEMVMISPHRYILRGQSTKTKENIVGMLETSRAVRLSFNTSFLEKQIDGIFDTDGNFTVDRYNKNTIYTYHYRNEYRILDSLFAFAGHGNTIDTITHARIMLVKLKSNEIKMNAPALRVNESQVAHQGLLYNVASLRGKFETAKMWQESKIVDVYHYPSATYQYSFTVPHDKGEKMRDMLVTNKYFYILRGNELIRYNRTR
jgi:hypothetical protein